MKQASSEISGYADVKGSAGRTVYRALRPLLCSRCGKEIREGELFTRWKIAGQTVSNLKLLPRCRKCEPFILRDTLSEPSELLESLLKTPSSDRQQTNPATNAGKKKRAPAPERDDLAHALLQRLGPALARCRRSRW